MTAVCADIALAILAQRFAKIPRLKDPEESRAISAGREDSRCDDLLQCCRRAHANKRLAHSKSAAIPHVESANPPRVPQARAPRQMLTTPVHPKGEMSVRRSRRKARALVRVETKTSPATLPARAQGFQSVQVLSDAVANAKLVAETQPTDLSNSPPGASSGADTRPNRCTIVPP